MKDILLNLERLSDLDKEIVSFTNSSGGRIFIGISDNGEIKGIRVDNVLRSRIQDIANNCDPPIKIKLQNMDNILIIHVLEGIDKPYRCSNGFYIRTGSNSQKLSRDQIVSFIQSEGKVRFEELINKDFGLKDISSGKLNEFLKKCNISRVMKNAQLYKNLGIAESRGKKLLFNNLAVLFFAKNLSKFYYHTVITCVLYQDDDKAVIVDKKDFNSDVVYNVEQTMKFLAQHISLSYEFTGDLARKEKPLFPALALREALINAVIHRNYFEKGANVFVEIYKNRIEMSNPGGLVSGINQKNFGKISLLRNPGIANLFQRLKYIEKMGTGIERIKRSLLDANLPEAEYEFNPSYVKVVFQKNKEKKTTQKTTQETTPKTTQEKIFKLIMDNPTITRKELSALVEISEEGIKYHLNILKMQGIIKHTGSTRKGKWKILKRNEK